MLGAIDRNEVDTFAADFTPSPGRIDDFVFTPPYAVNTEAVTVGSSVICSFLALLAFYLRPTSRTDARRACHYPLHNVQRGSVEHYSHVHHRRKHFGDHH